MDEATYKELVLRKAKQVERGPGGLEGGGPKSGLRASLESGAPSAKPGANTRSFEAVIRWYRPVLKVINDEFERGVKVAPEDPDQEASKAMMELLDRRRGILDPALRSVGRIELRGNARFPWVGTGWIIASDDDKDIVITNAHVAREFAMRSANGFVFRPGIPDAATRQQARIDFREELGSSAPREFPIQDVIWISEDGLLDVALLRVARGAGNDRIDAPVALMDGAPDANRMVAVVGYPGSSDGYDPEPFERLFGRTLGKKRFSPGFVTGLSGGSLHYDCSTLPGSSGSVVIDIDTGRAVGLHFAGTAFDTNYAVPAEAVKKVLTQRPWRSERSAPHQPTAAAGGGPQPHSAPHGNSPASAQPSGVDRDCAVSMTVPLEITVRLGVPCMKAGVGAGTLSRKDAAEAAARFAQDRVGQNSDVLSVRADYMFRDGNITDDIGVVVAVTPGASLRSADYGLGENVNGVELSVEPGDPRRVAEEVFGVQLEAFGGRKAKYERDLDASGFSLDPVTQRMKITLHVSPEAGWPVLKRFLGREDCDRFTVGMYHMTAPHVVEAIEGIARRRDTAITLTLDRQRGDADLPDDIDNRKKKNDIPERDTLDSLADIAGPRFKWAPASLGASGLFATAYHIKVAVWSKGGEAREAWLSSGNWQSSNQAPVTSAVEDIASVSADDVDGYNREWHAVIEGGSLPHVFYNHLQQDYEDNAAVAGEEGLIPEAVDVLVPASLLEARRSGAHRAFAPIVIDEKVKVQPLLTPDNYPEVVADLISRARERVLIENQSFNFWKEAAETPEHFLKIARAVKARQKAGLDVRVIFRSGFGKERDVLRQMKAFGLKVGARHVRFFDKCHTKGLVIDDNIAVLGSHNWTAGGVGPNRDASLVIWHPEANRYFAEIFEHDWNHVATGGVPSPAPESVMFLRPDAEAVIPKGYRRISLAEYLGET